MAKEVKETARQRRQRTSKFANHVPKKKGSSFEIAAIFEGNPQPQTAPFPNLAAALARFVRLSTNPALQTVKLIEYSFNNETGKRVNVLHQLTRQVQEFAGGHKAWWEARA